MSAPSSPCPLGIVRLSVGISAQVAADSKFLMRSSVDAPNSRVILTLFLSLSVNASSGMMSRGELSANRDILPPYPTNFELYHLSRSHEPVRAVVSYT